VSLAAVVPAVFIAAIILRTVTCYYVRFLLRRFAWLHPLLACAEFHDEPVLLSE